MAALILTTAERASIRLYCGWSGRWRQTDSRLEQAMNALDMADDDTMAEVRTLLASLASVDTELVDAHKRIKAAKLGSLELSQAGRRGDEIEVLRSEGRRFVGRLAATLGVEARQDVFSGSLPRTVYRGGSRSNLPPLG